MKRLCVFLACLVLVGINLVQAQTVRITGTVTSSEDGMPIPGVSVVVKGTTNGAATNIDGKYELNAGTDAQALVFSFVGFKTQEVAIGGRAVIDVVLESESLQVEELVVTALGITRSKKSLGYSTQEVKGDAMTAVKSSNFMNALSGKVTGVQIKKNNNMGGSTNVVVRGNKSLTGNNQVLYVIDGVPINNTINNISAQATGGVGYDYGNTASDVNPDDIESVNVLKGSAATALYGSRASNGVIMIVTKKGASSKKGIGVTFNSNVQLTSIDKSTFPEYQKQYGGGYGDFYDSADGWFVNKNYFTGATDDGIAVEEWVPTQEDASYGGPYDPNRLVYGWYSVDPESPWYKQRRPWVYPANDPITFFQNPVTYSNSISIDNSMDKGNYRLSYANYRTTGQMPNSKLQRDNFSVNATWKVTDKLTATASTNFSRQRALGRNSTGYNDNILSNMREWAQLDVDYKDQEAAYFKTRRNLTWNYNPALTGPIYTDNPYFQRYENYETDSRTRTIANMSVDYKITSWLDAYARVAVDAYDDLQEERRAVGSVPTAFGVSRANQGSGYLRRDNTFAEYNYDFMLNFNKDITESINLKGVVGVNERRTDQSFFTNSTNGGLTVPGIYSIQNSVSALPYPVESYQQVGVRGYYGSVSVGYKNFLFFDGTWRTDYSSTLPKGDNIYSYPSATIAFLFNDFLKQPWLSFGKVRVNYAEVGGTAPYDQLVDVYAVGTPLTRPIYALPASKKNPALKPESTKSWEAGLELKFLNNKYGIDIAAYQQSTFDQIMPISLSQTSGYASRWVNAGEIVNKGIELTINATPVEVSGFRWDINVNWSKNHSEVVSLYKDPESGVEITNLLIGSFQSGVTVNATKGEAYGALKGRNYTYTSDGQKIINAATGFPVRSTTSTEVLGNVNPDWMGGISNSFSYKGISFSFLIDVSQGGDIYSLDMYYGLNSGLYKETAFTNDLGNPVRNTLADGGGYVIEGVNIDPVTGAVTKNTTRVDAHTSDAGFGYAVDPNAGYVYDASFVKLREVSLSYNIPSAWLQKTFIRSATVSAVGSNLWIIHKNLPYADPEAGLSAGNVQGYSIGSLPSMREFGFNLKLNF